MSENALIAPWLERTPRGEDIMAACGQLKSASVKRRKSEIVKEAAAL